MVEKHLGLRIDDELLEKFRYVCRYNCRSANRQIIQLIIKFIAVYEKENGKIALDSTDPPSDKEE